MDSSRKVIISGTGRAGTTFLVQLLTELGLETGYTPGDEHRHIDEHSQGGLEHNLPGRRAPTTLRSFWRQPKHTLRDLFMAPAYCLARIPSFFRFFVSRQVDWIRTDRL